MSKKPCLTCGRPSEGSYCEQHRRERTHATTTAQRGYGAEHQRLRKQWTPLVERGTETCWRCGQLIPPGTPWDLGHQDSDRDVYAGPEHAACNRATSQHGRKA
jgi:hypothetical protein